MAERLREKHLGAKTNRGRFASRARVDADTALAPEPRPWRPGVGRYHPFGGYDDITETATEVRYLRNGAHHNLVGPAHAAYDGFEAWYIRGRLHRDFDQPAVTLADGGLEWWFDGRRHREHGPALVHADGREEWWAEGCPVPAPQLTLA